MKKLLIFVFWLCILASSCKKNDTVEVTPSCLDNSISQFRLSACDSNATVKEYRFQGKIVYLMEPGDCGCDMQSLVIDSNCNTLGALGGLTGTDTIKGVPFSTATYIRTVWHN